MRAVAVALLAWGCAPAETAPLPPGAVPETAEPAIRVALMLQQPMVVLGGGDALVVTDDQGTVLLTIPAGGTGTAVPAGGAVALRLADLRVGPARRLEVAARDSGGLVRAAGRDYRGGLVVTPAPGGGVQVVNRLAVEAYLAGVVNAEMGRRAPGEREALAAQAIVSRTYALTAIRRARPQGYDVVATVADQAYGGVAAELEQGWEAIQATRGMVLTWEGQAIEAFYHSTCAGRTAAGEEVYAAGARPYLRSVSDAAPDGTDWCAISPRYRWEESWTAAALTAVLRTTLAPLGVGAGRVAGLRDVTVEERTPSGRVARIAIQLGGETVPVSGPAIRQVLRPPSGSELLRSANFRIVATRAGGRLERITVRGAGAGHGVGMCQWGAVGRARAGATAAAILAAYFPGTALERRW